MKKILIIISLTVFSFSNAIAVTLYDALNQTYQNNIQLNDQSLLQDVSRLNQRDFARLGDDFRSQNRVAQVICRTR